MTRQSLRIFAGQPDPDNPARFTIDYQLDGQLGTIDGYLTDAGSVLLGPRDGRIIGHSRSRATWDPLSDAETADAPATDQ